MKNKILVLLPLVALFGLTACDSVQVKPTDYEKPIVTFNNDEAASLQVYHNVSKIVEDAYHDGSLASDVLDRVLYQYAVSIFGRYNKVVKGLDQSGEEEITLKAAVGGINVETLAGNEVTNKFINKHSSYWTTNNDGKRVDDNGNVVTGDVNASKSEVARMLGRWQAIEDLIATKLFNAVSGGSYNDRGIFFEYKYVESLSNTNKGVNFSADLPYYKGLIEKSVKPEEVFELGILNRDHYQEKYGLDEVEDPNTKVNYIEKDILPDIYKSLLVNQYLIDKKFNAIGNSYARKVNIIAIPKKTDFPKEDDYIMDEMIKEINAMPLTPNKLENGTYARSPFDEERFDEYSDAWVGIPSASTDAILGSINARDNSLFQSGVELGTYLGTEYGEMIKKYHELDKLGTADYKKVDSSIVSDFTGSGTYPKEIGKAIKSNEILVKDNTTKGWYISNGGLSELPDSIRTRLFSFSVATAFLENPHDQDAADRWQYVDGAWKYEVPEGESSYLARINNAYYLKVQSSSQGSDPMDDILFYDSGTSTHYIIQVVEAVRSAKLETETGIVGSQVYDNEKREEIINSVSEILAESGTYNSLANKYWLELATLKYHDQTVYDYFKANYPELFESE